jgi:peptidyl-prolyl cis-trans isomerase D
MALIGKIRNNFWFVLIILGLALASFVIMDIFGSSKSGGLFNQTTIGEVAGEKIEYTEFFNTERALFSGAEDSYASRSSLWDYMVSKVISDKAATSLGLGVSKDELKDLQFGPNPSPIIQNAFRNPNTGQMDRARLNEVMQAIEAGQELNPDFRFTWSQQEQQIMATKTQEKISNLVSKAMYTPKWMVEVLNQFNTESANALMVKIPFDVISDQQVKLTDADYSAYLNENKAKYTNEKETRTLEYATFDVIPTSTDSNLIFTRLADLTEEFKTAKNDSLFAANNDGASSVIYSKIDDFTGEIKNIMPNLAIGEVRGPFIENGAYVVVKLSDKRVLPDSVKARHILRSAQDPLGMELARKSVDSIKNLYTLGKQSFDSLAMMSSDDPGSNFKGGDLGFFAQGTMVAPFNEACFVDSKEGGLYTVETQFGVHLIEVQSKKFTSNDPMYKIAVINAPIVPSDATQDGMFDKVNKILVANRSLEALRKTVDGLETGKMSVSFPLLQNDFNLQDLGGGESSRSIIKWANTAAVGDVSPTIHEYADRQNGFVKSYVLAGLKSINKAGLLSVENAKVSLEELVKNKKKGDMIAAKIAGKSLNQAGVEYSIDLDSVSGVSYSNGSAELVGENKVIATIFGLKEGATSKPLIGNSGVYVVSTTAKSAGMAINNLPSVRQSLNQTARMSVAYRFWDAAKKNVKIKDNRTRFF